MLDFEAILPALNELARRLPGRALVHSHPVGANNQLQGQAHYLDFRSHVLLLLLTGLDRDKPRYSCEIAERPREEYYATCSSDLDYRMQISWAAILDEKAEELGYFRPRRRKPAVPPPPPLPETHYPVLAAALTQRMQGWNPSLLHLSTHIAPDLWGAVRWERLRQWWPELAQDVTEMSSRNSIVDITRLAVPWPISRDGADLDALEFYQKYPQGHGKLYLGPPTFAANGRQAIVSLRHSLGFKQESWDERSLPQPDGPRPHPFWEVLWLEKEGSEWRLRGHLPYDVESPPALLQAQEQARIQAELGDWGKVLKVEVDRQQAVEAKVLTPSGPRRVLSASAFYRNTPRQETPLVFEEPTVWIFSRAITGQAIIRAVTPPTQSPGAS